VAADIAIIEAEKTANKEIDKHRN